jgi:hypothetical protein
LAETPVPRAVRTRDLRAALILLAILVVPVVLYFLPALFDVWRSFGR